MAKHDLWPTIAAIGRISNIYSVKNDRNCEYIKYLNTNIFNVKPYVFYSLVI